MVVTWWMVFFFTSTLCYMLSIMSVHVHVEITQYNGTCMYNLC